MAEQRLRELQTKDYVIPSDDGNTSYIPGSDEYEKRRNELIQQVLTEIEALQKPFDAIAAQDEAYRHNTWTADGAAEAVEVEEHLKKFADTLTMSNLTEREATLKWSEEVAKILAQGGVKAEAPKEGRFSVSSQLKSIKDFVFKDYSSSDKSLKAQEAIKEATETAEQYLKDISKKLPSPAVCS